VGQLAWLESERSLSYAGNLAAVSMYRRRVLGSSVFFCCEPEMVSAAMNINNALSKSKRGIFLFMGARISRRTLIAPVGGFACRLLDRPQTGCILIYRDVWTVNTRWAFVLVFAGLLYTTPPASSPRRPTSAPSTRGMKSSEGNSLK